MVADFTGAITQDTSGFSKSRSCRAMPTALAPKIGYDKAAHIAKTAHKKGTTLREEALGLGYISEDDFNALMKPELMIKPSE